MGRGKGKVTFDPYPPLSRSYHRIPHPSRGILVSTIVVIIVVVLFFFHAPSIPRWNVSSPPWNAPTMCLVTSNVSHAWKKKVSIREKSWIELLLSKEYPPHRSPPSRSLPHHRRMIVEFNYQTTGVGRLLPSTFPSVQRFCGWATIRVGTKLLNMLTDTMGEEGRRRGLGEPVIKSRGRGRGGQNGAVRQWRNKSAEGI